MKLRERGQMIGITDFQNAEQIQQMLKVFQKGCRSNDIMLHAGVMCSYKSLNGQPTKYDQVWPRVGELVSIFSSTELGDPVFNCVHYADYDDHTYDETWKTILRGLEACGAWLDGLQLDMVWPDPVAIDTAIRMHRYVPDVILQVSELAFNLMNNDPGRVVEKISEYNAHLKCVLLDKSMGKGKQLDAEFLIPFLRRIRRDLPEMKLAVAGGLGPDTLHLIDSIVEEFPDISIDAQGRLRRSQDSTKPIDWDLAEDYLERALYRLQIDQV